LFTLLGLVSAAAMFWFVVPDTFAVGSVTILPSLVLVTLAGSRPVRSWVTAVISALTLSMTVTNFMFGIAAAGAIHGARRSVQIVSNAICLVLILWGIQHFIYPSTAFFYGYDESHRPFVLSEDMRTPAGPLKTMLLGSMVAPRVETIDRITQENYPVLSTQRATPGADSVVGLLAVGAWLALLAFGFSALRTQHVSPQLRTFLGLTLGGQLILHLLFGEETFLYVIHLLPLLLVVAALGLRSTSRPLVRISAAVLLVTAPLSNAEQFARSLEIHAFR
jgi:hypothetical protein